MEYVSYLLCAVALAYLVGEAKNKTMRAINISAFYAQIRKLIMTNNIDRAIKLCNAEPNALATGLIKSLLVVANRAPILDLYYEAARTRLAKNRSGVWQGKVMSFAYTVTLFVASMSTPARGAGPQEPMWGFLAAAVLILLAGAAGIRWNKHLDATEIVLAQLRLHLFARAQWHPPHIHPTEKLTAEELQAWKKGLDRIVEESEESGQSVAEVYGQKVDPTKPPHKGLPDLGL